MSWKHWSGPAFLKKKIDYVFWQVSIHNPLSRERNVIAATPSYKNTQEHLQISTEAFRHIDKHLLPTGNY